MAETDASLKSPPWTPLRQPAFRVLWSVYLAANLSLWMNDVSAAWLMSGLSDDPAQVALVQTASTLPVFLLALPSGAMADIIDRRIWLIVTQLWVAGVAAVLTLFAVMGWLTPNLLLALVFANGVGFAMRWPVLSAVVAEVVPRPQLPQAMALNSVAVNLSRIAGPGLAGALLAAFGAVAVFAFNGFLSLAAMFGLIGWKFQRRIEVLPGERFLGALRVGIQYVAQSPPLARILGRTALFYLQTTALISLLPLIARGLGGGAGTYTLLLACVGSGAIAIGLSMSGLRRRFSLAAIVNGGTLVYAASTVAAAYAPNLPVAALVMFPAGAAWIAVGNSLNVSAQLALPDWVRARGMAIFIMAAMAGNAAGAAIWGLSARVMGVSAALAICALAATIAALVLRRWGTTAPDQGGMEQVQPSDAFPDPHLSTGSGPVVITIQYLIDPEDQDAFLDVMAESRRSRLRNGALSWGLLTDTADPRRRTEYFVDASWVEHLRRVGRMTAADARLRERRAALHRGDTPPILTRHLGQSVPH